jgi:hypothetical protein
MKRISLKWLVRRFVLATSFPPFLQIYRLYYEIVTRMMLRIFKSYPAIKAVYLRRGGGKGEIIPLISDLDFTVIERGMQKEDKQSLHSSYQRLKRFTTVLDRNLAIYDEETFYKNYEKTDKRFRLVEGKETWKLLFGKDYLAEIPQLPIEEIYGSFYNEIKYWWTIFCWRLVQVGKDHDEVVIRNSVCYKTVSEILKMSLAFHHNMITFSRSEALKLAKAYLNNKEIVEVERLEMLAKKRFTVHDINIVEETKDFLLIFLDRFYKEFIRHGYARPFKNVTQRVDCLKDEMLLGREGYAHVRRLMDYVKEKWSSYYRGAYLTFRSTI